jgi:predicted nucleic acid-binding protein
MTRYGIDASVAVRLIRDDITIAPDHQLVAPAVLRSQVLSAIYQLVRTGEVTPAEATQLLDRLTVLRIRLLSDRVSRAVAWKLATQLDFDDTVDAEYLAVAQLQADAFVTLKAELADRVREHVAVVEFEEFVAG